MVCRALAVAVMIAFSTSVARAQLRPRRDSQLPRAGIGRAQGEPGAEGRQQLQRRFQQRLWQMTQRRVGLTKDQMNRLAPVHQRFETQRRSITREERQIRLSLRDAMADSAHADQIQISAYLDRLVQLQRQRADLLEAEQKELAQFMTPLQRARYTAFQEQVRRRIAQLAQQNRAGVDSAVLGPLRP